MILMNSLITRDHRDWSDGHLERFEDPVVGQPHVAREIDLNRGTTHQAVECVAKIRRDRIAGPNLDCLMRANRVFKEG
jgi:hypothetical protein